MLHEREIGILGSQLPRPRVVTGFATKHPSNSRFNLDPDQILSWPNFVSEVRKITKKHTSNQSVSRPPLPLEFHGVGNELGVQSRFIQHVSHEMSIIFDKLNLGIRIADWQYGIHQGPPPAQDHTSDLDMQPDLVFVQDSNHHIKVVGEVKTWWTFQRAANQSRKTFLALKFGQIAAYMHRYHCKYGFFTTYRETWVLKRKDRDHFYYSPALMWDQTSNDQASSVRDAFLLLGIKANNPNDSVYQSTSGIRMIVTALQKLKESVLVNVEGSKKKRKRSSNVDATPKNILREHY